MQKKPKINFKQFKSNKSLDKKEKKEIEKIKYDNYFSSQLLNYPFSFINLNIFYNHLYQNILTQVSKVVP